MKSPLLQGSPPNLGVGSTNARDNMSRVFVARFARRRLLKERARARTQVSLHLECIMVGRVVLCDSGTTKTCPRTGRREGRRHAYLSKWGGGVAECYCPRSSEGSS